MRFLLIVILSAVPALADQTQIRPGKYSVTVTPEIPNVRLTDMTEIVEICWRGPTDADMPLGPLGPGPLRSCPGKAEWTDVGLQVRTVCAGPNMGFAIAYYQSSPTGFKGRVRMNLGGKNMTVSETQIAEWQGPC